MFKHEYIKNVSTLTINLSKCTGCGLCIFVCPHAVLTLQNQKAFITNKNACMECGACATNCSFEAISVQSGVGCSSGIINGLLRGTEPTCDCSSGKGGSCC